MSKHRRIEKSFKDIKPVYFIQQEDLYLADYDIHKLLPHDISRQIRKSAFDHFLQNGFIPSNMTLLLNIRRLYPGQALSIQKHMSFHDLEEEPEIKSDNTSPLIPIKMTADEIPHLLSEYIQHSFIPNGDFQNFLDFFALKHKPGATYSHGKRFRHKSEYTKPLFTDEKLFRYPPFGWDQSFYFDAEYDEMRQLNMIHDTCANLADFQPDLPALKTKTYIKEQETPSDLSLLITFLDMHQDQLVKILPSTPGLLAFFYEKPLQNLLGKKNTQNYAIMKWRVLLYALWHHCFVLQSCMKNDVFSILEEVT